MFSGIIEQQAKIISIQNGRFEIENTFIEPLHIGQSIAHDGACMTLETCSDTSYSFFAMEESFKKTNF
jgi:riboflavin synthase